MANGNIWNPHTRMYEEIDDRRADNLPISDVSSRTLQVIYTWSNGREEIRYSAQEGTKEARDLIKQVAHYRSLFGNGSYSIRYVS